jgi:hypothetical protein
VIVLILVIALLGGLCGRAELREALRCRHPCGPGARLRCAWYMAKATIRSSSPYGLYGRLVGLVRAGRGGAEAAP